MSQSSYKSFCESPEFFLTDEELEILTDSTTGEHAPTELVPVESAAKQIYREFVPVYTSFYSGNESENYYPTTEPFLRFVPVEDLPPEEDNWGIPIPPPPPGQEGYWVDDPISVNAKDARSRQAPVLREGDPFEITPSATAECIRGFSDFVQEKYEYLSGTAATIKHPTRKVKQYIKRGLTLARRLKKMHEFLVDLDVTTSSLAVLLRTQELAHLVNHPRLKGTRYRRPIPVRVTSDDSIPPLPARKPLKRFSRKEEARSEEELKDLRLVENQAREASGRPSSPFGVDDTLFLGIFGLPRRFCVDPESFTDLLDFYEDEGLDHGMYFGSPIYSALEAAWLTLCTKKPYPLDEFGPFPVQFRYMRRRSYIGRTPIGSFLDYLVENQSEKEDRAKARTSGKLKDLSRENQRLRNELKQSLERLTKVRAEKAEMRKQLHNMMASEIGLPPDVENQAVYSVDVLRALDTLINVSIVPPKFASAALTSLDAGDWGEASTPEEICSVVCRKMVEDRLGYTREIVNAHYLKTRSTPEQFHDVSNHYVAYMKNLPYRNSHTVILYPCSWTSYFSWRKTNPDHFPAISVPHDPKVSESAKRISFMTKLCTYATSVAISDSWTEVVGETLKMIVYTTTPQQIDAMMRRSKITDLRAYVEERLRDSAKSTPGSEIPDHTECLENPDSDDESNGTEEIVFLRQDEAHYGLGKSLFTSPAEDEPKTDPTYPAPTIVDLPPKVLTRTPRPFSEDAFLLACNRARMALKKKRLQPTVQNQNIFDGPRDWIRGGINIDQKIADTPLLHVIDEAVCLAVFAFQDPDATVPKSWAYKELITRATRVHRVDALGLFSRICSIADTVLMICSTLADGVEVNYLMNPLNIELRLANLSGYYNSYLAGNLDGGKCKEIGFSMSDFEREAGKLADDVHIMLKNKVIKPTATRAFMEFRTRALQMKMKVAIMIKARTEKEMPYFVATYGQAGVGKTMAGETIQRVLSVAYDETIDATNTLIPSDDPNSWDTGANSATRFIKCPEHNAIKRPDQTGQILYRMTKIADTLPSEWNKPDLETKGSAFNFTVGGWLACNQKDFGIPRWVSCADAICRRIDFFEISVKEEFGKHSEKGNHLIPDYEKIKEYSRLHGYVGDEQYPDIHWIQHYTFDETSVGDDPSGASRTTKIKNIGERMSNTDWGKYMLRRARAMKASSEIYNRAIKATRAEEYCQECASAENMCRCCKFVRKPAPPPLASVKSKAQNFRKFLSDPLAVWRQAFPEPEEPDPKVENQAESMMPTLDLGFSRWITDILHATVGRFFDIALNTVFNPTTMVVMSVFVFPFGGPVASLIMFLTMFVLTCAIGTMSRAAAGLLVRRQVRDGEPPRYWDNGLLELAVLLVSIGTGLTIYANWKEKKDGARPTQHYGGSNAEWIEKHCVPDFNVEDQVFNPTTEEEVAQRNAQPDNWLQRVVQPVEAPLRVKTMTHEQVQRKIAANMVTITAHTGARNVTSRAMFLTTNVVHVVDHGGEFAVGNKVTLNFGGTGNFRSCYILNSRRNTVKGVEVDTCLIQLDTRFPKGDLLHMFNNDHPEYCSKRAAVLYATHTHHLMAEFQPGVTSETRISPGWRCKVAQHTIVGDCGSVLIGKNNPSQILGFHVALCQNTGSQVIPFEIQNYRAFLGSMSPENQARTLHEQMFFCNSKGLNQEIRFDEPSARVCTRWLRNVGPECTSTPPSVFPIGHSSSTRLSGKSAIVKSSFSDALDVAGYPRLHEAVRLNNNRTAATVLQFASRGCRNFPPTMVAIARRSYVTKVVAGLGRLNLRVKELTLEEAISGDPKHAFIKSMALNKAYGGGLPGKKIRHTYCTPLPQDFYADEYDEITVTEGFVSGDVLSHESEDSSCGAVVEGLDLRVFNDDVIDKVRFILGEWNFNKSCNGVYHFAIKDSPGLIGSDKPARGVCSIALPFHVAHTVIFGSVVGHLRLVPFVSGCYEGIDYRGKDWDDIACHHQSLGEEVYMIDLDTKKMDTSLSTQDLELTIDILADIAEGLGAKKEQVRKMRTAGRDMSLPVANLFGELLFMPMNMSGNKLTITFNNISGVQIRLRYAYAAFRIHKEIHPSNVTTPTDMEFSEILSHMESTLSMESTILDDFDTFVRVGSIGDDCMVSTTIKDFNMSFISGFFRHMGVTITGSSKSDSTEDNLPLRELACCQRGFRWSEEWNRVVGPLGTKSISRMLHMREPSGEEPEVVDAAIVRTALEELVFHGRQEFDHVSSMIWTALLESGQDCYHSPLPTYDSVLEDLLSRYPPSPDTPENRAHKAKFLGIAPGAVHNECQGESTPAVMANTNPPFDWLPTGDRTIISRLSDSGSSCEPGHDLGPANIPQEIHTNQEIINQSESTSTESTSAQLQNLEIQTPDASSQSVSIPSSLFPAIQSISTSDSMEDMAMRPIKLFTIPWNIGDSFEKHFDPWSLILTNQLILNKTQFYRFFQGELEITILVDGTTFHSGLAWATYIPLRAYDEFTQYTRDVEPDLVEMSQRMPLSISPRNSQGGTMMIPFMYNRDYLDFLSDSTNKLGTMTIKSIVPLRMANGGNQPAIITVLGRLRSMNLSVPTTHAFSVKNQSLSNATSNQEVTSSSQTGRSHPIASARAGDVRTSAAQMWQSRQSTKYSDLGQIETYVGTVNWSSNAGQDTVLQSLRCSPFHGMTNGPAGVGQEFHLTPAAWCGLPYTFWSGTVKYRFEIVCAPIHRGKLMFTWDPLYTVTDGNYNRNYSTIIDVGTNTEHRAEIGWGQDLPYLPTVTGMSQIVGQSPIEYTTPIQHANGVLTMSVFSPLVIPDDQQEANVTILVYASMGADYKLAVLRPALFAMTTMKNSDNQDAREAGLIQASNPQDPNPSIVPIPVVNPTLTTVRVLDICEEPGPLLLSRDLFGPDGINDVAWPGSGTDLAMDQMKMSSGSYRLGKKVPLNTELPFVLRIRGFVAGTTNFTLEVPAEGAGLPRRYPVTLSGITATADIIVPYLEDGVKFRGYFNVYTDNQVQVLKAIYNLPKWGKVVIPDSGSLTFAPLVNWYSLDGKTLLTDQGFVNRSGVSFRVRINPTNRVIGNVVVSYTATTASTFEIVATQVGISKSYLAATGSNELRHFPIEENEGLLVVIPSTSTITIRQVTYLRHFDSLVRTAIKALPVSNVVNQSSEVATSSHYGPPPRSRLRGEFFQEYHDDVMDALRHPSAFIMTTTPNPNSGVSGHNVLKIDHYPFVYRSSGNTTNVNSYQRVNHLFEYFVRAFIGIKGGMEIEVLHEPRGSTTLTGPTYGRLTRISSDATLNLASNTGFPATGGYQGYEWFNTRLNARVAATLPWQNRERFAYARSTDVANHIDYAYRYDHGTIPFERLVVTYRVGSDFVLGHFLSTPVMVQA